MEQQPKIETIVKKNLIGKKLRMALMANRTAELWASLIPRRTEIKNNLSTELISMQVYDESFNFSDFNQHTKFVKWATIEVSDFEQVPADMETFILVGGLYAVFIHKGANTNHNTFLYIFTTWLPNSNFLLDNRPHFEILGEKYKNNHPDSEEEVWIPIKPR